MLELVKNLEDKFSCDEAQLLDMFLISAVDGIVARKFNQTSVFGAWVGTDSDWHISPVTTKHVFRFSDQVQDKPCCTATEDGQRLEISDLRIRGIVLSM